MTASIQTQEGCNGTFPEGFARKLDAPELSLDKDQGKGQNFVLHPINLHANEVVEIILKGLSEMDGELLAAGEPVSLILPLNSREILEQHIGNLVWIMLTSDLRLLIIDKGATA